MSKTGIDIDQDGLPVRVDADEIAGAVWMHFGREVRDLPLTPAQAELLGRLLGNGARKCVPVALIAERGEGCALALKSIAELELDPGITVLISGYDLLVLVGQLQLALHHPDNRGPAASTCEDIARTLQAHLAVHCPIVAKILEAGWDLAADMPMFWADDPPTDQETPL